MANKFNGIKVEALANVRGEVYTIDCNGVNVVHQMANAKGTVNVGEVSAKRVQEKITAIVDSVCSIKQSMLRSCKVKDDDAELNNANSKNFKELEYYTTRLESILKYPYCKYFVQTQLYAHGVQMAVADLGELKITNQKLISINIADNRLNANYILTQLLTTLGYDCSWNGIGHLLKAISDSDFCHDELVGSLDESKQELLNMLLLVFEDKLQDCENKLKELYHVLTCSFASNLILGIRKHLCDVFGLGQITVKDVRQEKGKAIFYVPQGGKVVPQCTEVALIVRLSVPTVLVKGSGVKSSTGLTSVEIPLYLPVSMPKAISL